MSESGLEWYQSVCRRIADTADRFGALNVPGRRTWPIPFFGRLEQANVLTVGINPSSEEFTDSRWSGITTEHEAHYRLLDYFENRQRSPHPWFDVWEKALNQIDVSYSLRGSRFLAAHIDLSPRPTMSMGQIAKAPLFLEMLRSDLGTFCEALSRALSCRMVLLAGAATSRYYLNEFLAEFLDGTGWQLKGEFVRRRGFGKTGLHRLVRANYELPVFFCSTSPSNRQDRGLLIERIAEHRQTLDGWLK